MEGQEDLSKKASRLFGTVKSLSQRLAEAVQEGMNEQFALACVQQGILNFDLVEEDVKRIHRDVISKGDVVLGSHLILDDKQDFIEIRTYVERGNKTLLKTVRASVKRVTNIPGDILDELKNEGAVELHIRV